MNEEEFESLYKKYQEGDTSLEEEKKLMRQSIDSDEPIGAWSTYVLKHQIASKNYLLEQQWLAFEQRTKSRSKRKRSLLFIAASLILLLVLTFSLPKNNQLSYSEKDALLGQALEMLDQPTAIDLPENIIYKNDLITIYTTTSDTTNK